MRRWTDEELEDLNDNGNPFEILYVLVYNLVYLVANYFLLGLLQILSYVLISIIKGIRWMIRPWVDKDVG